MIHDAIKCAESRDTLYFLLTSYVDTLAMSSNIPDEVKSLPIRGETDVRSRAKVMNDVLQAPVPDQQVVPTLLEVAEVFDVASEQLQKL